VFLSEENKVSISVVLPIVYGLTANPATEEDIFSCITQFKTGFHCIKMNVGIG